MGPTLRRFRRKGGQIAAVVLTGAIAAAIYAGTGSSGARAEATASAVTPKQAQTIFAKYIGATKLGAAGPNRKPVVLGWINGQGGTIGFPEITAAVQVATNYINSRLNGIGGRPIKLKICIVVFSEEQGQTCAQKFANDPDVVGVLQGSLSAGGTGFHRTLAGAKPVFGMNPASIPSGSAANTFHVAGGIFTTGPTFTAYVADILKAKTVSLLASVDNPAGVAAATIFQNAAKAKGVDVKRAGFASGATDLLAPLSAADADSTDATVAYLTTTPACLAAVKAVQQLRIKNFVVIGGPCLVPAVKAGAGDWPRWTYVNTGELNVVLPTSSPYVAPYLAVMKARGATNTGPFPELGFGLVMTATKLLNQIGVNRITSSTFATALRRLRGSKSMFGPPNLQWGSSPNLPALGSVKGRVYTYLGNGRWRDNTNGTWLTTN